MDRGGEQEKKKEKTGERTTVVTDTLKKKTKQEKVHLIKNVLLFYFIQLRS